MWVGDASALSDPDCRASGRVRKIASLGVHVSRWVTWHGLALNVNTDLSTFRQFAPCGLEGSVMTSLAELLGEPLPFAEVEAALVRHAGTLLPGGPFETGPLPAAS